MNSIPLVKLVNINKTYKTSHSLVSVTALKEISLEVSSAEFVAIIGPSGSGKSTLLNIIGCLDVPTSGEYFMGNLKISHTNDNLLSEIRNKKIGFIFQNFELLPYSVIENVRLPLIYMKLSESDMDKRVKTVLEKVNLSHRAHHLPSEISGGEQQRAAIARAIITQPDIICADEPTGNLDTKTGEEIIQLFEQLNKEGSTIFFVTHNLSLANRTSRKIYLRDGKIEREE